MQRSLLKKLLCSTMLGGAALATAAPALAQDDDEDDAIVVTGSRLSNPNLASPSPTFEVNAEEINSRGITRVEDLINILPQALPGQTSSLANGAPSKK